MSNHVIFFHPDGTSPAHFGAARFVLQGPDGRLNWDRMSNAGVYLGHMEDQLTGTSNAGAVTHATGAKVYAESFGFEVVRDANGNPVLENGLPVEAPITAMSGSNQTILQEAVAAGRVTALINSGAIAEPGTGAFAAQVGQADVPPGLSGFDRFPRAQFAEITRQVVLSGVDVILGGGLVNYLPVGTPPPAGASAFATSAAQLDAISTSASQRPSINLIELAESLGYTVVYTREQLAAVVADGSTTKVLGIFANEDTFNDNIRVGTTNLAGVEENQIATSTPLYVPSAPTVGEMLQAAHTIMVRNPNYHNGSLVIMEEEGTDNFGNINNAPGMIEALRRTDEAIGVAKQIIAQTPNTLLVMAADSDAGGLQVRELNPPAPGGNVPTLASNPTGSGSTGAVQIPVDGATGRTTLAPGTPNLPTTNAPWTPFASLPNAQGDTSTFGISWVGTPDFAGAIVARAHGLNADRLPSTVDNTDIYRLMYETLFPDRDLADRPFQDPIPAPEPTRSTGNVIFIHPDGAGPSTFGALRFIDQGPDGRLNYDLFTNTGVYLGHLSDQLTGSSDGSAVTHAMGIKAYGDSYGLDPNGNAYYSLSGRRGTTILEEARDAGKSIAIINSGIIAEPGSGAFLAEVANRGEFAAITEQIVRAGSDPDARVVILGGGELNMLPVGTTGRFVTTAIDQANTSALIRPQINLINLAESLGFSVVYTLEELQALPADTQKVLGVFAATNTYDDRTEEQLGLNTTSPSPLYLPAAPTVAQMLQEALRIVSTDQDGFMVVLEEEGTDNFANRNNAPGTIEAARRADAAFGVAMDFIRHYDPNTLLITAADSEAGGLQVWQPTPFAPGLPATQTTPPTLGVNPAIAPVPAIQNPLDGQTGRTPTTAVPWTSFASLPGLEGVSGAMGNFAIGWAGTPDFPGSLVTRTYGLNAERLSSTVDNTDIYRLMYETLFGIRLSNLVDGAGGQQTFEITQGRGFLTVLNFGGIGEGNLAEVDSFRFVGDDLTTENLRFEQQGSDLVISFEGVDQTGAILRETNLNDLGFGIVSSGSSAFFESVGALEECFDSPAVEPLVATSGNLELTITTHFRFG